MENYSKAQLVNAMTKYNEKVESEPDLFDNKSDLSAADKATNQINYLIDIIETGVAI